MWWAHEGNSAGGGWGILPCASPIRSLRGGEGVVREQRLLPNIRVVYAWRILEKEQERRATSQRFDPDPYMTM